MIIMVSKRIKLRKNRLSYMNLATRAMRFRKTVQQRGIHWTNINLFGRILQREIGHNWVMVGIGRRKTLTLQHL